MNEETNVELMEDDNFFDPADFPGADDGDNQITDTGNGEEQPGENVGNDPIENHDDPDEKGEEGKEGEPGKGEPNDLFELKFNKETRSVNREEVIALAQKGLNHDRIQQQRDALQQQMDGLSQFRTQYDPVVSDLERIAKRYNTNPTDFLASVERNMLRNTGKSDEEVEAIIAREKSDRQLETYRQQEQQRQQQEAAQRRQQQDLEEFVRTYPNVDIRQLPKQVLDDVFIHGKTLVNAYGRYEFEQLKAENQRLQQQIAAKEQNEKNKQNAIGSMKSGSGIQKQDDFMSGFDEGW